MKLYWHHAKKGPAILKEKDLPEKGNHCLFIGTTGMLLCSYHSYKLHPVANFRGFQPPPQTIPESPGFHQEWIDACKGGKPATCNFDYSGPLAETVILGNVAFRLGEPFEWDAENQKSKNVAGLEPIIKPDYRQGYSL